MTTQPLQCQREAARFASTPADAQRRINISLARLEVDLGAATTNAGRRAALAVAEAELARVERSSGRATLAYDRTFEPTPTPRTVPSRPALHTESASAPKEESADE